MTDLNEEKTKSFRMPLIEIIIVVAVFAIVSVFIMRMYVSADKLQHESELVSRAVIELQNKAELFKGLKAGDNVHDVMGLAESESGEIKISVSFSEKLSANGSFEEQTGKTVTAFISATSPDGEKEYGSLTAAVYFAGEPAAR